MPHVKIQLFETPRYSIRHPVKVNFSDFGFRQGRDFWRDTALVKAADEQKCKPFKYPVRYLDQFGIRWMGVDCISEFAEHARRVVETDLSKPVVLSPNGSLVDGYHRVVKALVFGQSYFWAVRLRKMPALDSRNEEDGD